MEISGTVLGRQTLDADTRKSIEDAIAKIFVAENAEKLGAYGMFAKAGQVVEPGKDMFASFTEIAGVAGVELKDLK